MAAIMLACFAGPSRSAQDGTSVLMLYGLDPYLPPFLAMDKAMRESLASEPDARRHIFTESLDSQRFAIKPLEPELAAVLANKYASLRIDVVVAVSRTALDFFQHYGERIWPGARVVYVGFLSREFNASSLPPGASAVLSILDAAGTLDIAHRLQPGARRFVVVSGVSEVDRRAEQQTREALEKLHKPVSIEFFSGLPLAELATRIAAEPPDSVILYLAQFRDRDGRPHDPVDVLRTVIENARAPVYGAAETYIGLGAVAGNGSSYERKGRLVGEQVRRALAGTLPDASQVVLEAPSRCIADARALQRWALDPARLPGDCEIRFADVPLWRQYGWQIALTLAIIAGQSFLIAALVTQRRRRLRAEEAELAQRAAVNRAARLAVAGELTGAIAHEINQPLGAILTNVDVGELMLDSERDRREELKAILADIRRDDLRASEVIQRMRQLLGQHRIERAPLDLNNVVKELESILRTEARRRGIMIEFRQAARAMTIIGDQVQIQQVLINLLLNAMDAVADEAGSRRAVSVSVIEGEHGAVLAVGDRGTGIAPQHRDHLFDPFFSTKPNGMGLGLSITRTIVEAHGGHIRAENGPDGQGTVFKVELPFAPSNGVAAPSTA